MSKTLVSSPQRTLGALIWVIPFLLPLISQIVMLMISADRRFVFRHSAQSLMFQVGAIVSNAVLFFLAGMFWPLYLVAIPVSLLCLAVPFYGAMRAWNGLPFEPPISGTVAKSLFR